MTAQQQQRQFTPPDDLSALGVWIAELIAELEQEPDDVRQRVFALLDGVDTLHRAALTRLVAVLQTPGAALAWERATSDPLIRAVLRLYDLLPETEHEQVIDILSAIRADIERGGGALELVEALDGVVTVRVSTGSERGSPTTATLLRTIETALRDALLGFRSLRIAVPPPNTKRSLRLNVVPFPNARPPAGTAAPQWDAVMTLDELPPGTMRGVRIRGLGVLVCNVQGELHAWEDACPDTPLLLSIGQLDGEQIVCPWHGCRFDARGGRRVVHRGTNLTPYPVALAGQCVQVALNLRGSARVGEPA